MLIKTNMQLFSRLSNLILPFSLLSLPKPLPEPLLLPPETLIAFLPYLDGREESPRYLEGGEERVLDYLTEEKLFQRYKLAHLHIPTAIVAPNKLLELIIKSNNMMEILL